MNKPKLRQIFCGCNIFFAFIAFAAGFAPVFEVKCQPGMYSSPFLTSSAGLTLPVELSFPANPARLSDVASSAVCAAISPSPFGISELSFADAAYARRFSEQWVAGFGASGYATSLLNEFHGTLLSAVSLGRDFSLGAAGEFSRIAVRSYQAQSRILLHIGAMFRIDSSIMAAASFGNILRADYGAAEHIRQQAQFGVGVTASDEWAFDADVKIAGKASVEVAAKYAPVSKVKIRLAYSTERQAVEVFPAVQTTSAEIFSRLQWSNYLGFSQQLGVVWAW